MNYIEVMRDINAGKIRRVYLLHGEEVFLASKIQKEIIDSLVSPSEKDTNLVLLEADPRVQDLIELIDTTPFFGANQVIVVRGTQLFRASRGKEDAPTDEKQERATERLIDALNNMPDYSTIIFISPDKADKRRKLFKVIEKIGVVVEVAPLKPKDIGVWLKEKLGELGKTMDGQALEYILAAFGMMQEVPLGLLNNELEKLALYVGEKKIIKMSDVVATMSALPEISAFALTDYLSRKETGQALRLLEMQLSTGVHPLRILGMLAFEVRRLWQVKELAVAGANGREIAESLRIHPYVAEKTIKQSASFSTKTLKKALLALAKADQGMKNSSVDASAFETIIIEMCI